MVSLKTPIKVWLHATAISLWNVHSHVPKEVFPPSGTMKFVISRPTSSQKYVMRCASNWTCSQLTEDTRSGAFVLHSTCFFGHRRNGERGNLFLQTSGFHARSEVGSAIQYHTLLAEVPIDLLPYSLSHTIPKRSKIFSTLCCPLPSSSRPRHHWVSYHTRLLNPLFHLLKFPFFILCKHYNYATVVHPLLYISFNIIFKLPQKYLSPFVHGL